MVLIFCRTMAPTFLSPATPASLGSLSLLWFLEADGERVRTLSHPYPLVHSTFSKGDRMRNEVMSATRGKRLADQPQTERSQRPFATATRRDDQ